jgi:hypothetical protein
MMNTVLKLTTFSTLLCLVINPAESRLSRTIPDLNLSEWGKLDLEFGNKVSHIHHGVANGDIDVKIGAFEYTKDLKTFLESKPEFIDNKTAYYKKNPPKTVEEARQQKNRLRRKANGKNATEEDKQEFHEALRYYNFLLKERRRKETSDRIKKHEKLYKHNFFKFAKKACNDTLDNDEIGPSFSSLQANHYYKSKYSSPVVIDPVQLFWFPQTDLPTVQYDTSRITPSIVKEILRKKSATSAPGEDGLMYGFLSNLPAVHHFLATLYNKIDECGIAPDCWTDSLVVLIHKGGEIDDAGNFRMIALTSCMGKPYHLIKAHRLSSFMVSNGYLDATIQKGFMEQINGCIEHTTLLQEIIQHARHQKRTLHMSSFDLQDAFGSISHDLIAIALRHYHVPEQTIKYIEDLYSPKIFLIAFNPLLQYIKQFEEKYGYNLTLKNDENEVIEAKKIITTPFADDFNILKYFNPACTLFENLQFCGKTNICII